MKQEDKDLLLKDLCGRLPYGVKCSFGVDDAIYEICGINPICCGASEIQATHTKNGINGDFKLNSCKPYLFPISSMTDEEKNKLSDKLIELQLKALSDEIDSSTSSVYEIDYYVSHHIDYRGLIPMGLAIDATGLNIY